MDQQTSDLPQRKVSRYRLQRITAAHTSIDAPPLPGAPVESIQQDPLVRSRSRYRQKPVASQAYGQTPAVPPIPEIPSQTQSSSNPDLTSRGSPASPQHEYANATRTGRRVPSFSLEQRAQQPQSQPQESRQLPQRLNRRVDSQATLQSSGSQDSAQSDISPFVTTIDGVTQSHTIVGELWPPPRPKTPVKVDGPPSSHQIRATKATEASPGEQKSKVFGLFKKKRDQSLADGREQPRSPDSEDSGATSPPPPADAPVSAVNAGDRRVLMECGAYKMMYPVTPNTTPVDLIRSAATTMSNPVNVKSAVLLEYFGSVGVHRAIRRYEHIRDVMNSWDHDTQNSLLLIDPGTSSSETELGLTGVPKVKPAGQSWVMYYSQSVGKWDKRIVNLKRDGQITVQKDPKKPHEQTNVCHLSDFDIYTPTQEKLKKKVKPPKKHCFAIKSQQKSSMFESTTNFVHFFCHGEKPVADHFHNSIQAWRSWYLVHVMGEGTSQADLQKEQPRARAAAKVSPTPRQHHRMDSVDDHYQLGTFSSLMDMGQFGVSGDSGNTAPPVQSPSTFDKHARDKPPPLGDTEPLAKLVRKASVNQAPRRQNSVVSHRRSDLTQPSKPQAGYTGGRGLVNAAAKPGTALGRTSIDQSALLSRQDTQRRARHSTDSDRAFTGEGLLSQSQDGWGNARKGRGVLDGSRASGPMVQLDSDNNFARGSLLQKIEARQGPRGPGPGS